LISVAYAAVLENAAARGLTQTVALITVLLLCRGFAALASEKQGAGAGCVGYKPATKSRG
jgi:hypothetical protein